MDVIVLAIITCGAKVLIIRRALTPMDVPDLVWAFPGGKVEDGETLEQAVIREVAEETGLRISDVRLLYARLIPGTTHLALYYHCPLPVQPTGGDYSMCVPPVRQVNLHEVSAVAWASGPEALSNFTSDVASPVAAFLRGLR
jgi:8-oxo-dGTP diphosphatase